MQIIIGSGLLFIISMVSGFVGYKKTQKAKGFKIIIPFMLYFAGTMFISYFCIVILGDAVWNYFSFSSSMQEAFLWLREAIVSPFFWVINNLP